VKKIIGNKVKGGIQKRVLEVADMLEEFNAILQSADGELTDEEKKMAKVYSERLKKIEELKNLALNAVTFADKLLQL
jgi:hypothetical protein